jgi:hypothetical protein
MTNKDLDEKFLHNVSSVLSVQAGAAALQRLRKLEAEGDIAKLVADLAS